MPLAFMNGSNDLLKIRLQGFILFIQQCEMFNSIEKKNLKSNLKSLQFSCEAEFLK